MATINEFFQILSSFLWGWPMIVLLLGTHIFLTIRLRVPQRKLLTGIRLSVQKDKGAKGDVSQFGALTTALAATIGTGNIVGVATAVALGGPGAVLWCWLTGVFGMAAQPSPKLPSPRFLTSEPRCLLSAFSPSPSVLFSAGATTARVPSAIWRQEAKRER